MPAPSSIIPVKAQFSLQTKSLVDQMKGIDEHIASKRPAIAINNVKWLAGHLVNTRYVLMSMIAGEPINPLFREHFGKGSTGEILPTTPSLEEIMNHWAFTDEKLQKTLEHITEDKLKSPPPFQSSIPDHTIAGLIAYMSMHESHHIGQISVIKKLG